MPILRGFCYFCAIGVIFLFLFATTFFVACLVLDERRKARQIAARPDWSPPAWTRARPGRFIFQHWISPTIVKWPVSLVILGLALALAVGGAFGLANIKSDFDSIWYMRHESYQYKFYRSLADNFRGQGERVDIYLGNIQSRFPYFRWGLYLYPGDINYETNMEELDKIVPSLSDNEYIRDDSLQFWYSDFQVISPSLIVKLTNEKLYFSLKTN